MKIKKRYRKAALGVICSIFALSMHGSSVFAVGVCKKLSENFRETPHKDQL